MGYLVCYVTCCKKVMLVCGVQLKTLMPWAGCVLVLFCIHSKYVTQIYLICFISVSCTYMHINPPFCLLQHIMKRSWLFYVSRTFWSCCRRGSQVWHAITHSGEENSVFYVRMECEISRGVRSLLLQKQRKKSKSMPLSKMT